MASVTSYLQDLVRETRKSEAEVMALAMETGLRHLWREQVLGHYLRGRLTRDEAVTAVGSEWVDLADRQRRAVVEDVAWANNLRRSP